MMRSLFALAGVLFLAGAAPRDRVGLDFALRPVVDGGAFTAMDVRLAFDGEADGETVLRLPDDWGGETDLWRHLSDLSVENAAMAAGEGPRFRVLRHAPGARIVVRYRVNPPDAPSRKTGGNDYRPLIAATHFQLFGNAVVAVPANADMKAPARFSISGLPQDAAFATDMEHPRLTVRDVVESVAVGGDFRVLDAGGGVRVAVRGAWLRDDDAWRATLGRIGAAQRAYWHAREEPYLVTVLPLSLGPGAISIGGTGRGDAFAFFATPNVDPARFDGILAHEMMHTWVPGRIGDLDGDEEAAGYWLSEGFTDWASHRTNVRSGLWGPEDFAGAFNDSLSAYDRSPVRTAPNARIVADFWTDEAVQKLPYQRGMLLAARWDARLRAASGGKGDFDDALLAMQRVARRRGDVAADKILPVVMKRLGADIGADLSMLVQQGRPVDLPADLFAPCGVIVARDEMLWVRGFDFDATRRADWVIEGVIEGSNAWKAGLRNGMRLRRWSENSNERDPSRPVTAGVSDAGTERDITWLPTSGEARSVRRLELDPAMDRRACMQRLAGL